MHISHRINCIGQGPTVEMASSLVKKGREHMSERLLFGSAIRASIPSRFQDVSDFRPVPDHQEVMIRLRIE